MKVRNLLILRLAIRIRSYTVLILQVSAEWLMLHIQSPPLYLPDHRMAISFASQALFCDL